MLRVFGLRASAQSVSIPPCNKRIPAKIYRVADIRQIQNVELAELYQEDFLNPLYILCSEGSPGCLSST